MRWGVMQSFLNPAAVWADLGGGHAGQFVGHPMGHPGDHTFVHAGGGVAPFMAAGSAWGDGYGVGAGSNGCVACGGAAFRSACMVGSGGWCTGVLVAGNALGVALASVGVAAGCAHAWVAASNTSVGAV